MSELSSRKAMPSISWFRSKSKNITKIYWVAWLRDPDPGLLTCFRRRSAWIARDGSVTVMYCITSSMDHSFTGPVGTRDLSAGRYDDAADDDCCCKRGTTGAAARVFVTRMESKIVATSLPNGENFEGVILLEMDVVVTVAVGVWDALAVVWSMDFREIFDALALLDDDVDDWEDDDSTSNSIGRLVACRRSACDFFSWRSFWRLRSSSWRCCCCCWRSFCCCCRCFSACSCRSCSSISFCSCFAHLSHWSGPASSVIRFGHALHAVQIVCRNCEKPCSLRLLLFGILTYTRMTER